MCGRVCAEKVWMVCRAAPKSTNAKARARTRVCGIFDSTDLGYSPLTHASFRIVYRGYSGGMVWMLPLLLWSYQPAVGSAELQI